MNIVAELNVTTHVPNVGIAGKKVLISALCESPGDSKVQFDTLILMCAKF